MWAGVMEREGEVISIVPLNPGDFLGEVWGTVMYPDMRIMWEEFHRETARDTIVQTDRFIPLRDGLQLGIAEECVFYKIRRGEGKRYSENVIITWEPALKPGPPLSKEQYDFTFPVFALEHIPAFAPLVLFYQSLNKCRAAVRLGQIRISIYFSFHLHVYHAMRTPEIWSRRM